ncbi:MAG: hypothetical protein QXY74_07005 [Candidatus Bathyarchaeia archaeon]
MKTHMYRDSVLQWNVFVGCRFDCVYCEKSFKLQMKRQKNRCSRCYNYEPHFHPERLNRPLPRTKGDQFIWPCSSGDITFCKPEWMRKILEVIRRYPDRTFLLQTKNPIVFKYYEPFPPNVVLDVTLETNRDEGYRLISKAPLPSKRFIGYLSVNHPRKFLTIEPVLEFDMDEFVSWIRRIKPERVYLGYDSKNSYLPEPELQKVLELERRLKAFTRVKRKLFRKAWWEQRIQMR